MKLCNNTDGGEGIVGYRHTNKTIEQLRLLAIGNTNRLGQKHTQTTRIKMREARIGKEPWNKGKPVSQEEKNRLRAIHVTTQTQITKDKIKTANIKASTRNDNSSGFKGVSKHGNNWRAEITCDGIKYRLGTYKTKEKAADAYNLGALKYFGKDAFLNKIDNY